MPTPFRVALPAGVLPLAVISLALAAPAARGEGIAPGRWRIISRTETGGVIGPRHETSRCLTAAQVRDLAKTFSPIRNPDAACTPVAHSLSGQRLTWRVVCTGRLDMEETGEFHFDSPHHYSATTRTRAAMSGKTIVDSQDMLEAQWISECR